MEDWQPIGTAPRNEFVQIRFGDDEGDECGPYIAILYDETDAVWWSRTGTDFNYGNDWPTEWRPATPDKG